MATMLRILGWDAVGLRCPDHSINCCDANGDPFPVTLIQMPNGTGKTTTLSLLRGALSGAGADGSMNPADVLEFKKKDGDNEFGCFTLRLLLNRKRLTIKMELDFESGQIAYRTTYGSGQSIGFQPPNEVRRFLSEDFVNFFVFDGELAANLLDQDHTDARQAVESLFQVHLLDRMAGKVSEFWSERTRDVTAKDISGYTRRRNRLDKWEERLKSLEQKKEQLDGDIAVAGENLERQKNRYDQEIAKEEKRAQDIHRADETVSKFEDRVLSDARQILDAMREPQTLSVVFANEMFELKTGLDRVKLPESAAREFFEELAEEPHCICGRPIDAEVKEAIQTRAKQYLGSDDVALLNMMKTSIADAVGDSREAPAAELAGRIGQLSALVDQLSGAKNEQDALHQAAERSDPEVKKAKEEIEALQRRLSDLHHAQARFINKDEKFDPDRIRTTDPDRLFSIDNVREGVERCEKDLAEATNTLTLRQKRDVLRDIIGTAHRKAREALASEIRDEANNKIAELMPYNDIRIAEIDNCLVLEGQSGGSVGETLSVGYAFLSTLFNRSEHHELPFVVDSPANPIDLDIRSKIGELVPFLTGQFIGFVISTERDGFLPSLKKATSDKINYMTLFRKGATPHETKARRYPSCTTTDDGYLVTSEKFFNEFQLDSEEG